LFLYHLLDRRIINIMNW